MRKFVEYRNFNKCKECGGKCCKIYDDDVDGIRDKSEWFEEWCEGFHFGRKKYGVDPLFDPLIAHMSGLDGSRGSEWKALFAKGIDPEYCEYIGLDGCRISWEKRPFHCRIFKCDKFTDDDIVR